MSDLFSNLEEKSDLSVAGIHADWQGIVQDFLHSSTGQSLQQFLQDRRAANAIIYPPEPFKALSLTALKDVRVAILGQDPYHGAGQAEGLAFSVAKGVKIPPSLRNMFKERERDLGIPHAQHGSLMSWASQGILLLNTTLTVEDGQPASHAKRGWEQLTDLLIESCAKKSTPVAFLLWGGHAQAKQSLISLHNSDQRHLILTANHPSPLSALRAPEPFIGCGHFGKVRQFMKSTTLFS
jgi:uracil-DNA glycosylase